MGNSQKTSKSREIKIASSPFISASDLRSGELSVFVSHKRQLCPRTIFPTEIKPQRQITTQIKFSKIMLEIENSGHEKLVNDNTAYTDCSGPIENTTFSPNLRFFRKEIDADKLGDLSVDSFLKQNEHDLISTEMSEYGAIGSCKKNKSSLEDSLIDFSDVCPFQEGFFSKQEFDCILFK